MLDSNFLISILYIYLYKCIYLFIYIFGVNNLISLARLLGSDERNSS